MAGVVVGAARAHIDDAQNVASCHQRHGEHGFVLAFEHLREVLEPVILVRLPTDRHRFALPRHPARDALAQFQANLADHAGKALIGGAQHQLLFGRVEQVDLARICPRDLDGDVRRDLEHLLQVEGRAGRLSDTTQRLRLAALLVQFGAQAPDQHGRVTQLAVTVVEFLLQDGDIRVVRAPQGGEKTARAPGGAESAETFFHGQALPSSSFPLPRCGRGKEGKGLLLDVVRDDDGLGDLTHGFTRVHALDLDAAERLLLLQAVLIHQDAFGAVYRFARLQFVFQVGGLLLDLEESVPARDRDLDLGHQVGLFERLDQIGEDTRFFRPVDQVYLAVGGEQQHGRDLLVRDDLGGVYPVEFRHLDVENDDIGFEVADGLQGFGAVSGLPDDIVAAVLQHLLQVEADDRLIISDYNTKWLVAQRFPPRLLS